MTCKKILVFAGMLALCLAVTALFAWLFGFLAMARVPFS